MRFEPEAAPLLGNRVAEQPHLLGLVTQVVGYPILGQDLLLARDHGGANELPGLGEDLAEIVVGDLGSAVTFGSRSIFGSSLGDSLSRGGHRPG